MGQTNFSINSSAKVFPIAYSEDEAAQYLSISLSTIHRWRDRNTGPDFYRIGKVIRYRQEALERFVQSKTRSAA